VFKDKELRLYFLCLGNKKLLLVQRIRLFSTPNNLSKYLRRKYLKHIKSGESLSCNLCKVPLLDRMHVQQHA
jgi:hypothetical protein